MPSLAHPVRIPHLLFFYHQRPQLVTHHGAGHGNSCWLLIIAIRQLGSKVLEERAHEKAGSRQCVERRKLSPVLGQTDTSCPLMGRVLRKTAWLLPQIHHSHLITKAHPTNPNGGGGGNSTKQVGLPKKSQGQKRQRKSEECSRWKETKETWQFNAIPDLGLEPGSRVKKCYEKYFWEHWLKFEYRLHFR